MTSRVLTVFTLVGVLLAETSCSGDDDTAGGAAGASATNNVEFADTCTVPSACGGDPTGKWALKDACVEAPAGGFSCSDALTTSHGKSTGTLDLHSGNFSMSLDTELHQCGWIDDGGDSAGGTYTVSGTTLNLGGIRPVDFCVDGDTFWFSDPAVAYPDLRLLEFTRTGP